MNPFDSCENLRMGTAMFSKIYRIVTKWYGGPRPEAFEDAMLSYASGYFEGQSVFYAEDPGVVAVWKQAPAEQLAAAPERMGDGEDPPVTPANPIGEAWPLGRARGRRHHPSDHLVIKTPTALP